MKKQLGFWMILILCMAALPWMANAETKNGTCGKKLTWTLTDSGVLTISGSGAMEDYNLSSEKPWGNDVKQVEIQKGVTSIGEDAFSQCAGLTSVTIPESVTSIGNWAFSESGLTSIVIPNGVTKIGSYAFSWCSDLAEVSFPDTLTTIGSSAFYECVSLTDAALPDSVTVLGDSVFWDCRSLKNVTIPHYISVIDEYTFYGCSSLSSVTLSDGVLVISPYAFAWCDRLTDITLSNNLKIINNYAFSNCSALTSVTIPRSVRAIGAYTFSNCHALADITFKGLSIGIEATAFYDANSGMTVHCYDGAVAQQFAEQNKFKVEAMAAVPLEKPVITKQPASTTVKPGDSAIFEIVATDADSYQWYYIIPGGDTWIPVQNSGRNPIYILNAKSRHDGYRYGCIVRNSAGLTYSEIALLTILSKPVITTQPANVTVNTGETAVFEVNASDAESWQWYYQKPGETSWKKVSSNGDSATYTLTAATKHNGFQYKCRVKNGVGTVESDAAILTVNAEIVITGQPVNVSVKEGETATFEVKATGAETWQWYYQKPGETEWNKVTKNGSSAIYSLIAAAKHNGYQYKCEVKNKEKNLESDTVILTVLSKPVITGQPAHATVNVGETASFEVKVSNADSYQWYYQKPGETEWNKVRKNGGASVYTLTAQARHNGYQYKCEVKNETGTVETDPVTLTVAEQQTEEQPQTSVPEQTDGQQQNS